MNITLPTQYHLLEPHQKRKVREQYITIQNGLCFFDGCRKPLSGPPNEKVTSKPINLQLFPKGFLNNPIHLQHDHKSGLTEGAVHAYCNAVMWQYHGR